MPRETGAGRNDGAGDMPREPGAGEQGTIMDIVPNGDPPGNMPGGPGEAMPGGPGGAMPEILGDPIIAGGGGAPGPLAMIIDAPCDPGGGIPGGNPGGGMRGDSIGEPGGSIPWAGRNPGNTIGIDGLGPPGAIGGPPGIKVMLILGSIGGPGAIGGPPGNIVMVPRGVGGLIIPGGPGLTGTMPGGHGSPGLTATMPGGHGGRTCICGGMPGTTVVIVGCTIHGNNVFCCCGISGCAGDVVTSGGGDGTTSGGGDAAPGDCSSSGDNFNKACCNISGGMWCC